MNKGIETIEEGIETIEDSVLRLADRAILGRQREASFDREVAPATLSRLQALRHEASEQAMGLCQCITALRAIA